MSVPTSTKLEYSALDEQSREIRIFKLSSLQEGDDVSGELLHAHLDDDLPKKTPFEALSYAWGDPTDTVPIVCRNSRSGSDDSAEVGWIQVTKNLYAALKQLRLPDQPRLIWIDAICINQADIPERNSQVRGLIEVYSRAWRTVVWLGEDLGYDPFASMQAWSNNQASMAHSNAYHGLRLDDPKRGPEMSPVPIFARPWFRRKWIIQEVVLAKEVLVHCGSYTSSLEVISGYSHHSRFHYTSASYILAPFTPMSTLFQSSPDYEEKLNAVIGLANMRLLADYRTSNGKSLSKMRLVNLLHDTRRFECSDRRDFLFALLNVASDVKASVPEDLLPDYAASTEVIAARMTAWLLRNHGLDILSQAVGEERAAESGTHALKSSIVPAGYLQMFNKHRIDLLNPFTNPCVEKQVGNGETYSSAHDLAVDAHGRLRTAGAIIDRLIIEQKPSELLIQHEFSLETYRKVECAYILEKLQKWLKIAIGVIKAKSGLGGRGADYIKTFAATIFCYDLIEYVVPKNKTHQNERQWLENPQQLFQHYIEYLKGMLCDGLRPWDYDGIDQFDRTVRTTVICRELCVTGSGRFALVPPVAQDGDLVCLFPQAQTPHVVRRRDDGEFAVIGEAYVSGLMKPDSLVSIEFKEIVLR